MNSFLALFYTAFYLQDIEKLKEVYLGGSRIMFFSVDWDKYFQLLAALLITRQVIGNVKVYIFLVYNVPNFTEIFILWSQESLLPYAKKQLKLAKMSFDLFGALSPSTDDPNRNMSDELETHKKTDGDEDIDSANDHEGREQQTASGPRQVSQVEVEGSTPQYEGTFDDYLEMFIQFGYVTLFSSAYPLAGLCALLNNMIEVRSDAFKLCFIHQRPFPQRVQVS